MGGSIRSAGDSGGVGNIEPGHSSSTTARLASWDCFVICWLLRMAVMLCPCQSGHTHRSTGSCLMWSVLLGGQLVATVFLLCLDFEAARVDDTIVS